MLYNRSEDFRSAFRSRHALVSARCRRLDRHACMSLFNCSRLRPSAPDGHAGSNAAHTHAPGPTAQGRGAAAPRGPGGAFRVYCLKRLTCRRYREPTVNVGSGGFMAIVIGHRGLTSPRKAEELPNANEVNAQQSQQFIREGHATHVRRIAFSTHSGVHLNPFG
jgi:hypothetical protein